MKGFIEFLQGKKTYVLLAFGAAAAAIQYALGIDLGMTALPPAHSLGDLAQELYVFALGATGRAAVGKV